MSFWGALLLNHVGAVSDSAWYNGTMSSEVSIPNDAGKNELATADDSLSFEKWFLDLTALGIWQLSLVSYLLLMAVPTIVLGIIFDPNCAFFGTALSSGFVAWIGSVAVWLLLAQFRWPVCLRLIIALWVSVYLALQPWIETVMHIDLGCVLMILIHPVVVMPTVLPALAASFVALLPYVYREKLNNSKPLQGSANLIEKKN